MKVDVANVNDTERRMTVCVPPESVDSEIDKAYLDLKKNVKLRGFRPGKAPVSILERYFKAQVEEDVISKLVKNTYTQALEEAKASPVSQPKIENGILEKGKEFSYTAVFEVQPDITVEHYDGLALEKQKVEVTDEDVAGELQMLRNSFATMKDIEDRGCREGDSAVADFEGTVDGKPFSGGSQKDFSLDISDDAFLPGFCSPLKGMKKGEEKTFTLALPEDYQDGELAGKTAEFHVVLKELREKILPELDDEFAKDLGEYSTLEELKSKLRTTLTERRTQEAENSVREKIFDVLIEKNPFEVPQSMVENQARNMLMNMQQMFAAQGMKLEDMGRSVGQLLEQYKKPAERQVRSALLLGAVADKEGLTAEDADFEAKFQEIAEQSQQDMAAVKSKIDREMLRPQILEKKALDLIRSRASMTEK